MGFSTQIQLGSLGYLDITEDISIPLNLSIAPVQNIETKSGGFSKTINIPGTANNNILLGQLFDVNIADSSFNQNIKSPAIILQRGVPIFNGYMQLLDVVKTSSMQGGVDDIITYNVAMKDDVGDFYSSLNGNENFDGYLEDFDFSQYNHNYTFSAVTSTSANTWADAYKYHMFYSPKGFYEITDFKPDIFAKKYFDLIFSAIGYTYEWTGMSGTGFDKMVIPFNGDKLINDVSDLKFKVGFSADTGSLVTLPATIKFNEENSGNYDDSNNLYNTSTGAYTSNYYGSGTIKSKYYYEVWVENFGAGASSNVYVHAGASISSAVKFPIGFKNVFDTSVGTNLPITEPYVQQLYNHSASILFPNSTTTFLFSGYTKEMNATEASLFPGYFLKNNAYPAFGFQGGGYGATPNASFPLGAGANPNVYLRTVGGATDMSSFLRMKMRFGLNPTDVDNNYLEITPSTSLNEGRTLIMNQYIPKKIKWKEYVSSLVKLFNLYLTPSKDKDNHIIIQTRDEFYDSGISLDWTDKLDLSKEVKVQFLPDLQNKNILLSYKEGSDLWNKNYKDSTGEVYSQALYTFSNEFVQSTKKIETLFEPTPLVVGVAFNGSISGNSNNIISSIDTGFPKTGLRILYDGGWLSGDSWTFKSITTLGTTSTVVDGTAQGYPYAGHFYPTPKAPTDDLSFALPDYLYYDNFETLTDNGLYNKYYRRYFNQIENGKMMTCYMHLNEFDILNLDFRNKIFINDTYWYLNKIIDYNANSNAVTKVELINVDEGIKFEPFQQEEIIRVPTLDFSNILIGLNSTLNSNTNEYTGGEIGVSFNGTKNVSQGSTKNTIINGDYNSIAGIGSIISGDYNILNSEKSFVIGSNNTGDTTNSLIVGSNNTINSGVTDVFLFGSNLTASTTNALYANNIILSSGGTINGLSIDSLTGGTGSSIFVTSTGVSSIKANNSTINLASGDYSFVVGNANSATTSYSSIVNGKQNLSSSLKSFIANGYRNSAITSNYSTVINGLSNLASGTMSSVVNGRLNSSKGSMSFVGSGKENLAFGDKSFIGNGYINSATTTYSTIINGNSNLSSGQYSTIINGYKNSATTIYSTVVNGRDNLSYGNQSFIGSGNKNLASATKSFIGNGSYNSATANTYSTVVNGRRNLSSGIYSTIVNGFKNLATGSKSFIGNGYKNSATTSYSIVVGGSENKSTGVGFSIIGGGYQNSATTAYATVVSGRLNRASGLFSFIGGGSENITTGIYSTIGGGGYNFAFGTASSVLGGFRNSATTTYSVVTSGYKNLSSGSKSGVFGGELNVVSGTHSSILGGKANTLSGNYSSILGGSYINSSLSNSSIVERLAVVTGGTNPSAGVVTLVGGTITVTTNKVTANSLILLTHQNSSGTVGFVIVSARVAATSFTILSSSILDTSKIAWFILEPT